MSEHSVERNEYKIFLSCEVNSKAVADRIEKKLKNFSLKENKEFYIKCVKKRENIKLAMQDLADVNENCVYVINTHRALDNTAYWQLGYAMGREIKIIGYYDGKTNKKIRKDVDTLTNQFHSADNTHFLELISQHITKTIGAVFADWDKGHATSKNDPEAHDGS
jgi:nucleoside 2-deoxyribosyltransferase